MMFKSDRPGAPDRCPDCKMDLRSRGKVRHYCENCGERKDPDAEPSDDDNGWLEDAVN